MNLVGVAIGLVLLVIPGVMLAAVWAVAAPVAAVEQVGPIASLQRSLELTRGNRLRIVGFFVVATGLALVIGVLASLLLGAVIGIVVGIPHALGATSFQTGPFIREASRIAAQTIAAPIYLAAVGALYVELCAVHESTIPDPKAAVFD